MNNLIEMEIAAVGVNMSTDTPLLLLKEGGGERHVVIHIGFIETDIIERALAGGTTFRPMTHDLLLNAIRSLSANVRYVAITELKNDTFFGVVALLVNNKQINLDARPSDAIALAVRVKAPIYMDERIMNQIAFTYDPKTNSFLQKRDRASSPHFPPATDAERNKLHKPIREFIESLNLDDFK